MRGTKVLFGAFMAVAAVVVCVGFDLGPHASAAINQQINFQGKLTNTDGTNVTNGSYSIRFRIYTDASADATNACLPGSNSCKWEDSQSITVTDGVFSYALGSNGGAPLPGSVDFTISGLYLGIKVGADPEMAPRVRFTAAPYAFNSRQLDGVSSTGYVQLGQSATAQQDNSNNASIFVDKNTGTGNILQLQKTASDVFVINNTGNITASGTYNTNTFSASALTFGAASSAAIQSAASQALNITGHANSTFSTDAGSMTVQGFTGATLGSTNRTTPSTNSGTITIASGNATGGTSTAGNIAIDVGSSTTGQGAIQIGTAARAQTLSIGNTTTGTTLSLAAANGVSVTGATTVSSTTNGSVTLAASNAPGLSSGATTMTAALNATTFTTSVSITLNAGDFIVPTTSGGQARTVTVGGTGTSFTVNPRFSAAVTAETFTIYRPVQILTSSANNVGLRINTVGSNTDAFQIYSAVAGEVTASFNNVGDLTLGSATASGSVSTPAVSGASTALLLATGASQTVGNTGAITLQSGNATSGTSGNITIDNGTSTTGAPQINLGTTNARTISIGNTNAATVATVSVGSGTTAFTVQGASSAIYMQLDSTANNRLYIGNPTADGTAFLLVLDNKNTTGGDPTGVEGGMYYNSADNDYRAYQNNYWATVQPVRYAYLSADRASTATAYADVTDLSFSVSANTNYELVCNMIYRTAATTTGIKFALNGPATPNGVFGQFIANSTATALNGRSFNAYNGTTATTGVQVANTDYYGIFRAYFRNGANAGTLQLRYGTEVAGSAATARANSYCRLAEL